MKSLGHECMSCRKTVVEERLAAMHYNNVHGVKGKCEILHDVNLKDEVWDVKNSCHLTLESFVMKAMHENHPLFLATEQGAGIFHNDLNIVINARVKMHSKNWLAKAHLVLTLKNMKEMKTSIVVQNT